MNNYMLEVNGQVFSVVAFDLEHLEERLLPMFGTLDGITLLAAEELEVA